MTLPEAILSYSIGMSIPLLGMVAKVKMLRLSRKLGKYGTVTKATIIAHERNKSLLNDLSYNLVLRFTTDDQTEVIGKPKSFGTVHTGSSKRNAVGNEIEVIYDPENPDLFIDNRKMEKLYDPAMYIICFLTIALVAAFFGFVRPYI